MHGCCLLAIRKSSVKDSVAAVITGPSCESWPYFGYVGKIGSLNGNKTSSSSSSSLLVSLPGSQLVIVS